MIWLGSAVAWYFTLFEVVGKPLIVTSAIASVLFPAFGASFRNDRNLTAKHYRQGLRFTAAPLFPACLVFALTWSSRAIPCRHRSWRLMGCVR